MRTQEPSILDALPGGLFWFVIASAVGFAFTALFFRISGDLAVCRNHYPEMGTMQCYFSSKTVRIPGGGK